MVYCSGSIGIDPAIDDLVPGSVTDRARMALQNLKAVLEAAGSSLDRVVKANVFLTDMKDFDAFNIAWDEFFPNEPKPCWTCVAVHQLPLGTDVEIEMTASY
ncbi:endoribonuclease L-PSP [Fusarium agapanthi]|uniref:Endoribonuclease L-PSP n=1 Tax=Fusarium agapanthi TaxID=1803897 RepID=A0A9P5BRC9_9HYPO|nr:endoribonuclease L-PSP [Fusarium agapanthi]